MHIQTSSHPINTYNYYCFKNNWFWLRWVLVVALRLFHAACGLCSCGMHVALVPWPGIEPRPPALRVQSLTHWTTSKVPVIFIFKKCGWSNRGNEKSGVRKPRSQAPGGKSGAGALRSIQHFAEFGYWKRKNSGAPKQNWRWKVNRLSGCQILNSQAL